MTTELTDTINQTPSLEGKRVYISGRISGRRRKVARRQFREMELSQSNT